MNLDTFWWAVLLIIEIGDCGMGFRKSQLRETSLNPSSLCPHPITDIFICQGRFYHVLTGCLCCKTFFLSGEPRRADLDMQFSLPKSPVRRNQRTLVKPWALCPWASVLLHPAWHQISSVEKWVEWQAPCVTLSPALLRHELKDGEAPLWVSLIVKYGENKWRLKKRILSMTNNFSPKGSCH